MMVIIRDDDVCFPIKVKTFNERKRKCRHEENLLFLNQRNERRGEEKGTRNVQEEMEGEQEMRRG